MEQVEAPPAAVNNPQNDVVGRLASLFIELNIKSAYYVDDYNGDVDLPRVRGLIRTVFSNVAKRETLREKLGDDINIELPDVDAVLDDFGNKWETFEAHKKSGVFKIVSGLEDNDFRLDDYDRTTKLRDFFPDGSIKLISPEQWDEIFPKLQEQLQKDQAEKVLLIFDQDLRKAATEQYSSGQVQGQHLIIKVKESSIAQQSYCTLITHRIESLAEELTRRNEIAQEHEEHLSKADFFALAKLRIDYPELLCDGIKKALLNSYCELIKSKSILIIKRANKKLKKFIKELDTYDFDHTILRSSFEEGVWEAETFFRIVKTLFDHQLKKEMDANKYPTEVNGHIRKAKSISDHRFLIQPAHDPYTKKYELRHLDIYEPSDVINALNMPLENGDVFKVTEGIGINSFYILVAQECDLMIRSTGERSNDENKAVLLRISPHPLVKFEDAHSDYIKKALSKGKIPHYFATKFRLDYFNNGSDDVGIVDFSNPILVDLDILDLAVFHANGNVELDMFHPFSTEVLSTGWEIRYKILKRKFQRTVSSIDNVRFITEHLRNQADEISTGGARNDILAKFYPSISASRSIGIQHSFKDGVFKFGMRRVLRFRTKGATHLLKRFYEHLSRVADTHDFAKIGNQ